MFEVDEYINSLPNDTTQIDLTCKRIYNIPNLSRFKNLKKSKIKN